MKKTLALVAALAATASLPATALDITERGGHLEMTLQGRYLEAQDLSFKSGTAVALDSSQGFGIGFAYHLNDHIALGIDFSDADIDYTGVTRYEPPGGGAAEIATVSQEAYMSSISLSGTWYLFDRTFTPYVSGKIGNTYIDSGIPNGLPSNGCYWWWYTYVCGTYQPTRSGDEFSYGGGVGLRWELNDTVFFRGGVDRTYLDFDTVNGKPFLDNWRLDLGFRF